MGWQVVELYACCWLVVGRQRSFGAVRSPGSPVHCAVCVWFLHSLHILSLQACAWMPLFHPGLAYALYRQYGAGHCCCQVAALHAEWQCGTQLIVDSILIVQPLQAVLYMQCCIPCAPSFQLTTVSRWVGFSLLGPDITCLRALPARILDCLCLLLPGCALVWYACTCVLHMLRRCLQTCKRGAQAAQGDVSLLHTTAQCVFV